ncbi:GatB/YqeY domain-containing protein [Flavobacteriaceae bacterium]|nr:GatB/YqeY domain-containing protein [Flavobacteriaceae bacterium]MDA9374690.1 GatB/YqeY domain-containing protein [Flavobacteriaceae bacterium]MDB4014444.1 GatB/YqeY domain-containing protein [Flavobacteriaceae bacterium]|tara:strand:+ start:445 stop:894 length:450 start_codon:yes stop_codon:yes gene_type:complete
MKLIEKISSSIISAMKEKNVDELESLRAIKSALLLAQTQKGSDGNIKESDEIKILQKLVKQRKESAEIYKNQNRLELADIEVKQSKIIERFLPVQMNFEDLEKLIVEIINQTGAQGIKDMGKVMGIASVKLSGKADGKTISNIVRSKLV